MVKKKNLSQYCANHTRADRVRIRRAAALAAATATKIAARGPCPTCAGPFPADRPLWSKHCSEACNRRTVREKRRTNDAYRDARRRTKWRRRARGVPDGFPSRAVSRKVFDGDDWKCRLCGVGVVPAGAGWSPDMATVDHITPLSRGGHPTDPANLQTACARCNSLKSDKVSA